jgi:hypothetical protein
MLYPQEWRNIATHPIRRKEVRMQNGLKQLLFWSPRVLGLLFALFVSLFALDVFGQGYSFWATIGALLMHLMPVYILLIALVIGWRWAWAGALLFIGFSIWYLIVSWGPFPLIAILVGAWPLAAPALLVGLLFLLDWLYTPKLQVTH